MYSKTTWADRAVATAKRYLLTLVSGTTYDIDAVPGTITNEGTTVTAAIMNNMEQGIYDAQLYGADSGGDDTYVVNLSASALFAGMTIRLLVTTGNTGACTLSIDNGTTTKDIKKPTVGGVVALVTGDIPANSIVSLAYDGTQWQLQSIDFLAGLLTAKGDMPYASSANTPARLPVTTDANKILGMSGGIPTWMYAPLIYYMPSDTSILDKGTTEYTTTTREPSYATIDTFRLSRGGFFRLKGDVKVVDTRCSSTLAVFYDDVLIANFSSTSATYESKSGDSTIAVPPGAILKLKQRIDGNYDTTAYAKNIVIGAEVGSGYPDAWT